MIADTKRYNITLVNQPSPFVWFRVAKTGTRTVLKVLRESGAAFVSEEGHQLPLPKCGFQNYFKFTFVRNPYDRLISGWTNKVINGGSGGGLQGIKSPERLMNFDYFVDWLINQNPNEINIHYRPQALLVPPEVDFTGRTESIERDLQFVLSQVGLDVRQRIPHENSTGPRRINLMDIKSSTIKSINILYREDFERFDYPIFNGTQVRKNIFPKIVLGYAK
jgi:hypothetical protein